MKTFLFFVDCVHMVADMEVDKVADKVADMVADMSKTKCITPDIF